MTKTNLTQKELKVFLHYCPTSGVFTRSITVCNKARKGDKISGKTTKGYIRVRIKRTEYYAHRLAWLYVYGEWPKDQIDHINRDKSDNRITNLRDVTCSENNRNKGPRKKKAL